MAQNIPELYGSLVFNDKVMRSKLPKDMYKALKKTIAKAMIDILNNYKGSKGKKYKSDQIGRAHV